MPADTINEVFVQPDNRDATIWRYMDFTKYVSLLEASGLWFCRVDQLGDPFEGAWTPASDGVTQRLFGKGHPEAEKAAAELNKYFAVNRKNFRDAAYVNCWHLGEHESAAMWRLYARSAEAIAIRTTYAQLAEVLPKEVLLGRVRYVDYDVAEFGVSNVLLPLAHKRLSFNHEQEVRALKLEWDTPQQPLGLMISVDLNSLVECVYVSPDSPAWYEHLVRRLTERFGRKFEVKKSRLSDRAVF